MRTSVMVVMLMVVGLFGAGCSQVSAQIKGDAAASRDAPARPILVTQDWGIVDGMLSVVVKNTTDRTLRGAEGVITVRDRNDVLIVTSLESVDGACCAVVDLPPGQEFGFYVDVGASADDVSRVEVAYRNVSWAAPDKEAEQQLSAQPVSLGSSADATVVNATVSNSDPVVAQASVQAFLTGPDGEFLAVVAGRWYCVAQGTSHIQMQLLHPVPAGTTVDRVVIHPVPDETGKGTSC
jgi:hypothetical protein